MTERTIVVPAEAAGERLDKFLSELPEIGSRAAAERALLGALVDGSVRPKSFRLVGGEEIELVLEDVVAEEIQGEDIDVRIAYEDQHLLVIDKPAGLVVHPGAGIATGTLANALVRHRAAGGDADRPGIVHRLDKDTSGLLVVARSEEAHKRLQKLVQKRTLEREYTALVKGRPKSWEGRIEAPIGRDRHDATRQSLDTETPREAITHFEVAELLPPWALLKARLETGRTHQIRVHFAAIELPVAGDPIYGVAGLDLRRQFLHASRLAFPHPFGGKRIEVHSPLPPDLEAALELARTRG
jgi:23S rRNA pseudouridine1911/1915/1917 synthase